MTPQGMHNQTLEQMRRTNELLEAILARLPEAPPAAAVPSVEVHAGVNRPPASSPKRKEQATR